ncbi:MAG TPA: hypothetical protein VNK43_10390 [Gemmatimonadales bacterium]|nr:hypothetical protein [Gemmatimonadales bacterium]
MADPRLEPADRAVTRPRHVRADTQALVVGVVLFGLPVWGPPLLGGRDLAREVRNLSSPWLVYVVAGALAFDAVALGQHLGLARAAMIGAVLLFLATVPRLGPMAKRTELPQR